MNWKPMPATQRCTRCGQDWWDSHVCPSTVSIPVPPGSVFHIPNHGAPKQLTEADVRRIVREELAAEKEENRRKLRALIAEVHGADPDPSLAGRTSK